MYLVGGLVGNWLEGTFGQIPGVQSDQDISYEAPSYNPYDEDRWITGSTTTTTTTKRESLVYQTTTEGGGLLNQLGEAYNEASEFVGGIGESVSTVGSELKEWSDLGQKTAETSLEMSSWTVPLTYVIMLSAIALGGIYLFKK